MATNILESFVVDTKYIYADDNSTFDVVDEQIIIHNFINQFLKSNAVTK